MEEEEPSSSDDDMFNLLGDDETDSYYDEDHVCSERPTSSPKSKNRDIISISYSHNSNSIDQEFKEVIDDDQYLA